VKRECGLGKDMIFTGSNLKMSDNYDLGWDRRRDIWISRYKYDQQPKAGEIIDAKIAIEWNGTVIIVDWKIYTLWNLDAINQYLSMLTDL
jgi:hypothetical protein